MATYRNYVYLSEVEWQKLSELGVNSTLHCISIEEIIKAVKRIKNGKAPGPDHIPSEVLKISPEATANILHDLFKTIWETDGIPDE